MKKKILTIALALTLVLSFTACGGDDESENSQKQTTESQDTSMSQSVDDEDEEENEDKKNDELETEKQKDSVSIDIEKCISDLKENLPLEPDYTFVNDYYIGADGDNLTISIVVDDSTDPNVALDFADTVVRQLNLYANMQDSSIALGNKDYYGGLYEYYTALVGVAPASQTQNQDSWFVFDAISGGETMLELNEKYR